MIEKRAIIARADVTFLRDIGYWYKHNSAVPIDLAVVLSAVTAEVEVPVLMPSRLPKKLVSPEPRFLHMYIHCSTARLAELEDST